MKFYIKNEVVYNNIRKFKGEIIDIPVGKISELQKANVIGEPVGKIQIETAAVGPKENEVIRLVKGKKKK